MEVNSSHLVLDACCMLNLSASGCLLQLLTSIPAKVVITEVVMSKELLSLQKVEAEYDERVFQFEQAIDKDLLFVVDFESELEEETFIDYAFAMRDDGESATGAIAVHRGWAIATDDKRAISFLKREAPQLVILSTLDIIKCWSDQAKASPAEIQVLLMAIKVKGRYIPHKQHPLYGWWQTIMS